jgi:hypothetical protein
VEHSHDGDALKARAEIRCIGRRKVSRGTSASSAGWVVYITIKDRGENVWA